MFVFEKKADLERYLKSYRNLNQSIGLVPTMGAIHQGHLSLIGQSMKDNDCTVVSVFVNPTQFNNAEDLAKYPRNIEKDVELIQYLSDDIVVFAPTVSEMYPKKTESESFDYDGLEFEMEGASRPGHFDGVGTIVKKLFQLVMPTRAYFGEKDFQQLQIIRKMVEKEKMNLEIIGCPIFRGSDGLALSSRNERLSKEGLEKSSFLYHVLTKAKELFKTESPQKVQEFVELEFKNNSNFELEYFVIADEETLKPINSKEPNRKYRGFLVAHIENIRLIDNLSFN